MSQPGEPDRPAPQRELPPPGPPPPFAPPKPRRRGLLVLVVALALLTVAAWALWPEPEQEMPDAAMTQEQIVARLGNELAALKTQAAQLDATVGEHGGQIAAVATRLNTQHEALGRLSDTLEAGRARVQLAAVEQLLLLANDRLLLAHDVATALRALELADQRLAALDDPGLFPVREALATERAALAALPRVDVTGAALAIAAITQRLPAYPLRAQLPAGFEPEPPGETAPDDAAWPRRAWFAVRTALGALFTLRRSEGPAPRLLAPDQEALIRQVVQLKLDGARLALIGGDGAAFRDLVTTARGWLADYYHPGDAGVQAALAELDRLGQLERVGELPDISRSLALLRAQFEPRGR